MNCQKGDIARCVGGPKSYGRVVQCLELIDTDSVYVEARCGTKVKKNVGEPTWHIDGWIFYRAESGAFYEIPCCTDRELRPIRDPGDDAQDEMLRPLPKAEPADTRTGQEVAA